MNGWEAYVWLMTNHLLLLLHPKHFAIYNKFSTFKDFFNSQNGNIDKNPITACPFNNFKLKGVPPIIITNAHTKHFQSWDWDQSVQKCPSITALKRYCSRISCSQTEFSAISPHRVTESCCYPLKAAFRPACHKTRKCVHAHTPRHMMEDIQTIQKSG